MRLAGRDRGCGEAAVEEIRRRDGTAEFLQADFSSPRAVRGLAAEVRSRHARLDVTLNNAGGVNAERQLTPDGIEQTFAVNYLATFCSRRNCGICHRPPLQRLIHDFETHLPRRPGDDFEAGFVVA